MAKTNSEIAKAAERFLWAEAEVHKMYSNTATCRSGPGVIAGQAFTKHCAVSCSNPDHAVAAAEYREAKEAIIKLLGVSSGE